MDNDKLKNIKNIQNLKSTEEIKKTDKTDLIKGMAKIVNPISGGLGNPIQTWKSAPIGVPYAIKSNEADIPVVMRIGRGYNVFGEYASVESLKQQVLDVNKLIKDEKLERIRYDDVKSSTIESKTVKEYSESMSVKAGVGGKYYGFSASVETNFDRGRTQKTDNYFSTFSHIVRKYSVYVKAPTKYDNYLTSEASAMLNAPQYSPRTVFDTFGHFVLVDTITGGRIDYNVTAESKASTSFENFMVAAKADVNTALYGANASSSYSSVKNTSSYMENRLTSFRNFGGMSLTVGQLSDPTTLSRWADTLEDQGTLVEFGNTTTKALLPIWELCTDPSRKAALKAEFDRLNQEQGNKWPQQQYVTDVVFVMDGNEWNARSKCPAGYQLINADLNKGAGGQYIYLCYKLGGNPNEAYTDFFMEITGSQKGQEEKQITHNSNHVKYSRIVTDLNRGSGGKYIYMWGTKERTLPPITGLEVAFDKAGNVNPTWDSVYWQNTKDPADVNKSVGGKYIYIKFGR